MPDPMFPGKSWEFNKIWLPEEVAEQIDIFVSTIDTTGLLIIKNGKVVYEYGNVREPVYLGSVRKSILSMLYGPYVANGTINLNYTLKDLGISDIGGLLPIEKQATVINLITSRSGVYHPASNDGDLLEYAPKRGSKKQGSYWLYSNWDFNAAGVVFERLTGKNIYDALQDDLAIPIGMQDFDREQQRKYHNQERSQHATYSMWLSAQDMARLGYLMLRNGKWEGRQIIPHKWVQSSTTVFTPIEEMNPEFMRSLPFGYGYMWWVWDGPNAIGSYKYAYTASGVHGQFITVLPELDIVVVHVAYWSPEGAPRHHVKNSEYYGLLDLIIKSLAIYNK
ncbi:MAG: serine hydrolase [Planctomycetes bacterium]|nr:serine hydrolase [Planctomycetota bacterium]